MERDNRHADDGEGDVDVDVSADPVSRQTTKPEVILNASQAQALFEIEQAYERGARHLLTGFAGSGKTTLMQQVARIFQDEGKNVVMTAPTHKAVAVLARKLAEAGIEVPCCTIHSLLSLRPKVVGDKQVFERADRAREIIADVVVIDEASMLDTSLMGHIRSFLKWQFVLFVGDPAQLPPVGEIASEAFSVKSRSHLDTIIRQVAGNPILEAARIIRESQGTDAMDWSWLEGPNANKQGLFRPGAALNDWMRRGFLSDEFAANPDHFRYLCWTNKRVHEVNRIVRRWRYGGGTPTPLMPGEPCMARTPVFVEVEDEKGRMQTEIVMQNCEEGVVLAIEPATVKSQIGYGPGAWSTEVETWRCIIECDDGRRVEAHMIRDERSYKKAEAELREWSKMEKDWRPFFRFKEDFSDLRSLYALTVHSSQGSTFKWAVIDVGDIAKREEANMLECQQLFYVAITRATDGIILGGVDD
jgi:exodeoxyribonuclease-5